MVKAILTCYVAVAEINHVYESQIYELFMYTSDKVMHAYARRPRHAASKY